MYKTEQMNNKYYKLILERLKNLNQLGELKLSDKECLFNEYDVQSIIHSVAYSAELIEQNICDVEKKIYNKFISHIYNFLFLPKPASIILEFNVKDYNNEIKIKRENIVNINTGNEKYNFTILENKEYIPLEIISSEYIEYTTILTNNYFGNYFLKINIKINNSIYELQDKIIKLFINSSDFDEIIKSSVVLNRPVYIYKDLGVHKIGNIILDEYGNIETSSMIQNYFDYLYTSFLLIN